VVVAAVVGPTRFTSTDAPSGSGRRTPPIEYVGGATTSVNVAEWLREPVVPITLRVELPAGVFDAVVTSNVAVPDPVREVGMKTAVAFAGSPATPRLTDPVKPFTTPMVTV
jgi:hypothetical protein